MDAADLDWLQWHTEASLGSPETRRRARNVLAELDRRGAALERLEESYETLRSEDRELHGAYLRRGAALERVRALIDDVEWGDMEPGIAQKIREALDGGSDAPYVSSP